MIQCNFCGHLWCKKCCKKTRFFPGDKSEDPARGWICKVCDRMLFSLDQQDEYMKLVKEKENELKKLYLNKAITENKLQQAEQKT